MNITVDGWKPHRNHFTTLQAPLYNSCLFSSWRRLLNFYRLWSSSQSTPCRSCFMLRPPYNIQLPRHKNSRDLRCGSIGLELSLTPLRWKDLPYRGNQGAFSKKELLMWVEGGSLHQHFVKKQTTFQPGIICTRKQRRKPNGLQHNNNRCWKRKQSSTECYRQLFQPLEQQNYVLHLVREKAWGKGNNWPLLGAPTQVHTFHPT